MQGYVGREHKGWEVVVRKAVASGDSGRGRGTTGCGSEQEWLPSDGGSPCTSPPPLLTRAYGGLSRGKIALAGLPVPLDWPAAGFQVIDELPHSPPTTLHR